MDSFIAAENIFQKLIMLLQSENADSMGFSKAEILIKTEGKQLLCSLLQSHIDNSGEWRRRRFNNRIRWYCKEPHKNER